MPQDVESLSPSAAQSIDRLCNRFEDEWKSGQRPLLEDYLNQVDSQQRPVLLQELLPLELIFRRRHMEMPNAAEYVARLPDLASAIERIFGASPDTGTLVGARQPHTVQAGTAAGAALLGFDLTRFLALPEQPGELGRLGPFRILGLLGQGGMGAVFLAEDVHLQRQVAIKMILPRLIGRPGQEERFLREARLAASIKHDHVVTVHHVGNENGVTYLAMELLQGESLETRLARERMLAVHDTVRIGRQIAEGLAAAHAQGFIHRDIKPGNIWLETLATSSTTDAPYRVKILDFGLARPTQEDMRLTASDAVLGTPAYMAPEQAEGQALDARCDLFSLGAILYRACTGAMPFSGTTILAVLHAVANDTPPPVGKLNPAVPKALADLVTRLLAKEPARRPPSARYVVAGLWQIEHELDEQAHQTTPVPLEALPRRRPRFAYRNWTLGLGMLAAAVLVGLIVIPPLRQWFVATDPVPNTTLPPANAAEDRDRRVAIWVLAQGGVVGLTQDNRQGAAIMPGAALPDGPFTVFNVNLSPLKVFREADLARLNGLSGLAYLNLSGQHVTDDGLRQLKDLPELYGIYLDRTAVTDRGLEALTQFASLSIITLGHDCDGRITDAGIERLCERLPLTELTVFSKDVTDRSLTALAQMKSLRTLSIGTSFTNVGLTKVAELPALRQLTLANESMPWADLVVLAKTAELHSLRLESGAMPPEGMTALSQLRNLKELDLRAMKTTEPQAGELQKDLAKCRVLTSWQNNP